MGHRIRHCVECPKCFIRYLVARSPYTNGSYLAATVAGTLEEYTLYCSCGRPPISSRWRWDELKAYEVTKTAYDRGYGGPEEVFVSRRSRASTRNEGEGWTLTESGTRGDAQAFTPQRSETDEPQA